MDNLLPALDSGKWERWFQREAISPQFGIRRDNGETILTIAGEAGRYVFGKWICSVQGIVAGDTYSFSVEYMTRNVGYEAVNAHVILSWFGRDGEELPRDYADEKCMGADGWHCFRRELDAPAGACSVVVELVFWGTGSGEISWRNPVLVRTGTRKSRKVRVAATLFTPRQTLADNLAAMEGVIDKAAAENADIVVLTEMAYDRMVDLPFGGSCQTIPGSLTDAMAAKARQHNAYIIVDLFEKEGELIYNTAVLIDRKGEIAGKYRKTHLPLTEKEKGITPGDDYPVFDTDFGRIGILICMDQVFPEPARILRLKGAEILFIPTIGYSHAETVAHAVHNGMYVVVSGGDGAVPSRVINPNGEILAKLEQGKEGAAVAEIDLAERLNCIWMSVGPGGSEPRIVFVKERRTDTYGFLLND